MSDTIETLIDEYRAWNAAQGLNLGSADEHLFDATLTDAQRDYLRAFCDRWDRVTMRERIEAERDAYIALHPFQ
jgi:hypothetical protein